MALAATVSTRASMRCHSYHHQPVKVKPTKNKLLGFSMSFLETPSLSSSTVLKLNGFVRPIQASNSPREHESPSLNDPTNGIPLEDINFLGKLGAGSVAGGAVIKYGSILFPEITRPNIYLALIMISTPVIIAIVLLIKQSRSE